MQLEHFDRRPSGENLVVASCDPSGKWKVHKWQWEALRQHKRRFDCVERGKKKESAFEQLCMWPLTSGVCPGYCEEQGAVGGAGLEEDLGDLRLEEENEQPPLILETDWLHQEATTEKGEAGPTNQRAPLVLLRKCDPTRILWCGEGRWGGGAAEEGGRLFVTRLSPFSHV